MAARFDAVTGDGKYQSAREGCSSFMFAFLPISMIVTRQPSHEPSATVSETPMVSRLASWTALPGAAIVLLTSLVAGLWKTPASS